jgi:hypothetical protein
MRRPTSSHRHGGEYKVLGVALALAMIQIKMDNNKRIQLNPDWFE